MEVRIYGMPNCKWCNFAKILAKANDIPFEYLEADKNLTPALMLDRLGFTKLEERTLPKIYEIVDGKEVFIGGYTDFERKVKSL